MMGMSLDEVREKNRFQEMGESSRASTQWENLTQFMENRFNRMEMGI